MRPLLSATIGSLLVLTSVGCSGSSDAAPARDTVIAPETDADPVDDTIVDDSASGAAGAAGDIPLPPDFDPLASNESTGLTVAAGSDWAGSRSADGWPGLDQFIGDYTTLMADAGFELSNDEAGRVGQRDRRVVKYANATLS